MERKYRKWQSSLIIAGKITIALGVWDVIQSFVNFFIRNDQFTEYDKTTTIIMRIFLMFYIAIIIGIRIFVGKCAITEGKGGKTRYFYLVIAVFMLLINLFSLVSFVLSMFKGGVEYDTLIIACLFDILSSVSLIEMFVSSIVVKRIGKKLKKEA